MTNAVTYLVVITAYCHCSICCGKWSDKVTASGKPVKEGVTAAANWLPFGTRVYVEGVGWRTIQDRMSKRFNERLDIYFNSHAKAKQFGIRTNKVWILKQE